MTIQPASGEKQLPEGAGRELIQKVCTQCHALNIVTEMKLAKNEWQSVVETMVDNGASLEEKDIPLIIEYLSKKFSKERSKASALRSKIERPRNK